MVIAIILFIIIILVTVLYFIIAHEELYDNSLLGHGGIVDVGLRNGYCYATIYDDNDITHEVKIYTNYQLKCGDRILINKYLDGKYYYI